MVIRYGLIGLGVGLAGVAVYRVAKRRRAQVASIARTAARNLSAGALSVANGKAPSTRNLARPRKHRNTVAANGKLGR